jgi:hypothetical protein
MVNTCWNPRNDPNSSNLIVLMNLSMNLSKENFLNKGRQTIENQINNTQSIDLKSFLGSGGSNRDLYEEADLNGMYNYYLNIRKVHLKTCRDLLVQENGIFAICYIYIDKIKYCLFPIINSEFTRLKNRNKSFYVLLCYFHWRIVHSV